MPGRPVPTRPGRLVPLIGDQPVGERSGIAAKFDLVTARDTAAILVGAGRGEQPGAGRPDDADRAAAAVQREPPAILFMCRTTTIAPPVRAAMYATVLGRPGARTGQGADR